MYCKYVHNWNSLITAFLFDFTYGLPAAPYIWYKYSKMQRVLTKFCIKYDQNDLSKSSQKSTKLLKFFHIKKPKVYN